MSDVLTVSLHRLLRLLVIIACLVPPALVIAKIVGEGVNVPFMDQWDKSSDIALSTLDGTLTFEQLTAFHNQHRILFTNLLTVFSARFLQWNLYLELFFTVALAFALLGLLIWMIRQDFPEITFFVTIPISALVFSLRGAHTWMTSFQSCFLWVTLFFLLGLCALRREKAGWLPLVVAAVFAFCSTFSLANGVLAWVLLGVGLPLLGYRKARYLLFWVGAAVVCLVLYYAPPRPNRQLEFSLASLPQVFEYALAYLGGVFVSVTDDTQQLLSVPIALFSIVLLLANATYLWRRWLSWKRLTPWLLIAGYAAGTAALTGLGRLFLIDGFPYQALSERYIVIAVFWWISLIVLGTAAIYIVRKQRVKRLTDWLIATINLLVFAVAVVLFFYVSIAHNAIVQTISPDSERCYGQYLITHHETLPCLPISRMVLPERWLPKIDVLSMRRLAMFNTPQLDVSLNQLPFVVVELTDGTPQPHYETFANGNSTVPALFEHPDALIEYTLTLPDWYPRAEFVASLYLDPTNVERDPSTMQDGVIFSASIIDEDGQSRRSAMVVFDPNVNSEPIPFTFDLSEYAGQVVRLQLQTESRESSAYDWALWVDPMLRLSD